MGRYSSTEQMGVHAVGGLIANELGWIFREQPIADMGIDGHIERVDGDRNPTGQLLGVQIKTGKSHFHESKDAYIYYGSGVHVDYWTGHSLPVILVAHLPETGETPWVQINGSTIERTAKHWKVVIPKSQQFGKVAQNALEAILEGPPRQQRFRRLEMDEPLMRHITAGLKVTVELEDWHNKSLGRSYIKVHVYDADGTDSIEKEWFQYFIAPDVKTLAQMLFPWATARVDQEFYDENSEIDNDDPYGLSRATDEDNGFAPPEPDPDELFPYADSMGEVAVYRLQLILNDLGRAFLDVSTFLDSGQ